MMKRRIVSGSIKSFTMIRRLLERGEIKEKDVLILDEPEIHLHPQWQLVYAEIIVLLQKSKNRDELYRHIRNRANTVRNLYEIRKLEGFLFENAWTYNEEQFAEFFEKRYETEEAGEVCVS